MCPPLVPPAEPNRDETARHVPVLIAPLVAAVAPVTGIWLDGTFGAGGYARALLDAGAQTVIGVDRDPLVFDMAQGWVGAYGERIRLCHGNFADLDTLALQAMGAAEGPILDGVVLDLGVSSMQIDAAERGFSFQKDGPLDMRMSQEGPSAADLVNTASESHLADILYHYGEERAARRIARAICATRDLTPYDSTLALVRTIEKCLPRPKPGQSHPATRSFQALRIAVNAEFSALVQGLQAAERALRPGGWLAVVTFHSLEDRIVKRFLQNRSGHQAQANRFSPAQPSEEAPFALATRRAIGPDPVEEAANPRARSAKLRFARRTNAAASSVGDLGALGMPQFAAETRGGGRSKPSKGR